MVEWIKKYRAELKRSWYIPLMLLAGVLLMLRPSEKETVEAVSTAPAEAEDQAYTAEVEARVTEMLRDIRGAGECRVTVSLASKGAYEYVRESGNVLVIRDENGNESPVLVREGVPEIAGVTVASSGAGSAAVRNDIIEAVSTLLGIGSNKICVVMRNSGD